MPTHHSPHLSTLVALLDSNPNRTLQSLGDALGLTRERVRQLINQHNLRRVSPRAISQTIKCQDCPKTIKAYDLPKSRKDLPYVCRSCHKARNQITVVCENCNKHFKRARYYQRSKLAWCSRRCQGKYIGRTYGFGAFPEHSYTNLRKTLTE